MCKVCYFLSIHVMEENQNQLEKLNRIRLTDYYFRKLRTTEQVW